LAFFLKYPNPYAKHVLSADVLDQSIDEQGKLHTTRLILKKGILPKWGSGFVKHPEAYIIEHSVVDPVGCSMSTSTMNITHQRLMKVEEVQTIDSTDVGTRVRTQARVVSEFGWGLRGRIEGFGISKFVENAARVPLLSDD
jgi:hypothetical protein